MHILKLKMYFLQRIKNTKFYSWYVRWIKETDCFSNMSGQVIALWSTALGDDSYAGSATVYLQFTTS